jgi:DNA-binding protein WhiA
MSFTKDIRTELLHADPHKHCCVQTEREAMLMCSRSITIYDAEAARYNKMLRRACCRRAFLRGVFLMCGSANAPQTRCHLEFIAPGQAEAELIARALKRCEIKAKSVTRKEQIVIYIKEGECISALLRLIGAHRALLAFEDARVKKEMNSVINRQVNCDEYNAALTVEAARRKVKDIQYIKDRAGLNFLPEPLRQIAKLRLDNEEATLAELGLMLSPALGKSGVNNRLRRLSAIADQLRANA